MSGTTSSPHGLDGVVAVRTRLSHVDRHNGVLIIAGHDLEELAGRVTLEEAAHLLWTGRLPGPAETEALCREMAALCAIPDSTIRLIREAANRGASPIDTLRMACSTLSLDVAGHSDVSHDAEVSTAKMLVARVPTIIAAHTRAIAGQEPIAPRADLSLAANFLYMVSGQEPDPMGLTHSTRTGSR
jgi:citrate synthase